MIKEIQYKGYATEPSDYECPDGQLATSLNLINEDNQLKPVFQPAQLAQLPSGYKVVYIHDTNTFTHYVLLDTADNTLYWIDESIITDAAVKPVPSVTVQTELEQTNPARKLYSFNSAPRKVNAIGNTLLVLADDGMHYFLWKSVSEGYLYLGTHLPELPCFFSLSGSMVRTDEFNISFNEIKEGDIYKEFSEENKAKVTEQVLAKVNKFIQEESTDKGRFMFPFFVRYAYRLYDGSLTMHSAPVLMIASSGITPQVIWDRIEGKSSYSSATLRVVAPVHRLAMAVVSQENVDSLNKWKDIIRSVDVFISKPIYTYDQNGQCSRFAPDTDSDPYCVCFHENQHIQLSSQYNVRWQKNRFSKLYAFTFNPDTLTCPAARVMLPQKTDDAIKQEIKNTASFYLLDSIKLERFDGLAWTNMTLDIKEDYLQSLVNREVMTDDYDSHDQLVPTFAFPYNSRMNIANIRKILFNGYHTAQQFNYTNGYVDAQNKTALDSTTNWYIRVYIRQDGKDIVVQSEPFQLAQYNNPAVFFYYPNINAYKAVITSGPYGITYEVKLEQHAFLNGAFYFNGWDNPAQTVYEDIAVSTTEQRTIDLPNKIYTSEVNNPFQFPVLGINTVGTGTILGISTAAKALSQGQFGQFPLYAFTTDGVWALEVSSTGSFSAKQPITRDVCVNSDSITQIDSSVLFATDRGIMLISGSQTQCITDSIFSEAPFNVLDLPCMDQLHTKLGHSADACLPIKPFRQFIADCQMIYDYVHQRIFVYNPTIENGSPKYTYAYVFSLKSKMWGMVFTNLASTINSYPEALAMTLDNKLVSFSETDEQVCKGLYITRPLKLEAADVQKTISTLIQRGHFQRGDVGTVLYGSRDLFSWHLVWSSKNHYLRGFRGTPYKYFRIAGLATLTDGKSIFGASVSFETRNTNQLR